jgi:O-antigen/teichoic acid export membrane protein
MAYMAADIVTTVKIRRYLKFPKFRMAFKQPRRVWDTLKKSQVHLFTDNGIDLLLNIDLFVLGLFVSAWDLGVYAEAAVLVRLFLIVSLGIKPILRRQYAILGARRQINSLMIAFKRRSALLFSLQAILALVTLLYFPKVLDLLFELREETTQSFKIFLVFVPGLIFYAPFSAQEPVYEALGQAQQLKQLTLITAGINLLLSLYLVPAAGIFGAAAATMITMLAHFILFGRHLTLGSNLHKSTFATAGLALYLVYALLETVSWGPTVNFWLGPMLVILGFYGCGVFGVELDSKTSQAFPDY